MGKLVRGATDLATVRPDLAREWHPTLNGDLLPAQVSRFSNKMVWWVDEFGHEWPATINKRSLGRNCPYCSNQKVLAGFNDLATGSPDIAATWHPTKNALLEPTQVLRASRSRAWWLCAKGHEWPAVISSRSAGRNCPYCSNQKVLQGFNDLATTDPEIAATWHPTKNGDLLPTQVTRSRGKKAWWLCAEGHEWSAVISSRTAGSNCPRCAKFGYDQTSPGYLYLLRKEHFGLQQFGITNRPDVRLGVHRRSGWEQLDVMGPADGVWIVEVETALGRFFQDKGVLLPRDYPDKFEGYSESWRSDELSFSTCAEMLEALRGWEAKV